MVLQQLYTMKKIYFFLIIILLAILNTKVSQAIYSPTIDKPPTNIFIMGDCENINVRQRYPQWGPVGGWWDLLQGHCQDSTPENYLDSAASYQITLENGQQIPKPFGLGLVFNFEATISNYLYLNNKTRYPNLAFIIASAPAAGALGDPEECAKMCYKYTSSGWNCECPAYGEISDGYSSEANDGSKNVRVFPGRLTWAKAIMGPLSQSFPKLPIIFQVTTSTFGPLAEQALSLPNKNILIKVNAWEGDPEEAVVTLDGEVIGGNYALFDRYYDKLALGFEPRGDDGTSYEERTRNDYWWIVEGLSHHPDFFDLPELFIAHIADFKGLYQLDLFKFWQDYTAKDRQTTPGFWVILRETGRDPNPENSCWIESVTGKQKCVLPWIGNFSYWLYQKDEISGGKTKVLTSDQLPSPANTHPYGIYKVRSTDQASQNPYLYFDVDNDYSPPAGAKWKINITYLNKGADCLALEYYNSGNQLIQKIITKTNTNQWVDASWLIDDISLTNHFSNQADFRINCLGDNDEIVHRVLLEKNYLNNYPTGNITPSPIQPTRPPTTIPGSPTPQPTTAIKNYNLDGDKAGRVNQADLNLFLTYWSTSQKSTDFNDDGKVNEVDLTLVLANWRDTLATKCVDLGGVCCIGDYGYCVAPRLIYPYNEDGTVGTSGGCNPEQTLPAHWCCSGCKE
jgi:hypothetical protein